MYLAVDLKHGACMLLELWFTQWPYACASSLGQLRVKMEGKLLLWLMISGAVSSRARRHGFLCNVGSISFVSEEEVSL